MVNRINMLHFVLSRLIGFVDQINMMFKFKLSVIDIGFAAYKCMLMSLHMLLCLWMFILEFEMLSKHDFFFLSCW